MGVDLGALLRKQETGFEQLRGRIIAVDAFNTIYQFLSIIRGADGSPLMDSKGNVTSHLSGLLYRTTNLIEADVKPVFVFDGTPSILKKETREKRNKIRTDAEGKYLKALKEGKMQEAKKYAQQTSRLSSEMVKESKKLLELMGVPVVQAAGEGEATAAQMAADEKVYACASQDYDALLFGAPRLIRNLTVSGKRKLPGRDVYIDVKPEIISLNESLQILGVERKKLVWIAIMIGTDFNEKLPGIGPKKALSLAKKHDSFEEILKETGQEIDWRKIEKIFLEKQQSDEKEIVFSEPSENELKEFLCNEKSFSPERVEKAVEKLREASKNTGKQARLEKWFG